MVSVTFCPGARGCGEGRGPELKADDESASKRACRSCTATEPHEVRVSGLSIC